MPRHVVGGPVDKPARPLSSLKSGRAHYTSRMAEPATKSRAGDDAPPFERLRAQRRASLRFWFVVLGLLAIGVLLTLTTWREVERLFGL